MSVSTVNNMHVQKNDQVLGEYLKEVIIRDNPDNLKFLFQDAQVKLKNYRNSFEGTLLHEAVELGSPNLVKYLIKEGLDVEAKDSKEGTPLIRASRNDNLETRIQIIKILLDAKANVHARAEGKPALHHFLENSQRESAALLIEYGADINSKEDKHGYTLLHISALHWTNTNIMFLLEHNADPRIISHAGQSALQLSFQGIGTLSGHKRVPNFEILKMFLERGANPNAKVSKYGSTVFQKILQYGDEKTVRLFIKHGARYGSAKHGKQVRLLALKNKNKNIFDLIVQLQEYDTY